ncbi:MinD/ParA family ATP-binding protein [Microbacterium aurantiacum]|uniref:MinD/ParA family ATP-binding protein n=1 Tax=Microbacterium aurantiacum TaxID=162393 RepID=UPI001FECE6F9|nr:MinD/ParA family protein [Microbacterium aurantiacum]
MTPKNIDDPLEDDSRGVLDAAASLDTTGIGILGGTAQVNVALPKDEDDDLADDGVVEGEIIADLIVDDVIVDEKPFEDARAIGRIHAADIIIEIPAESETTARDAATIPDAGEPDAMVEEPVVEEEAVADEPDVEEPDVEESDVDVEPILDVEPVEEPVEETPLARERILAGTEPVAAPVIEEDRAAASRAAASVAAESAAAAQFLAQARADRAASTASTASAGSVPPLTTEKETPAVDTSNDKAVAAQPVRAAARAEVALTSKRLDDLGDAARESADLLTADRLLDPHQVSKPEPEGAWSHLLYSLSGRRINIGDGRRARERKALTARIAAPLVGGARFVPVLSRKGGVGKTTITALLGMALADAREDRVIAVDANPDRGTLADRIVRPNHSKSVRDLVRIHDDVKGYHDLSAIVSRDATRLDVLASDSDPRIAEAFSDNDYRDVADVAAHYYSLVLTDTGTGIVHSVMSATLDLSDQIVIVCGLSVDEARLASETLTWLETNGYAEQAREAIVVLNQSTPGTPLVRLNELEAHFATRAKRVVRVPYDAQIAGGGTIVFSNLRSETRQAARELAAHLVEGLRTKAA